MPETAPALQPKPLVAKPTPVAVKIEAKESKPAPTSLSTSKVWVLPPRPKPGRKPSADTPPNKRKAQNRAAQRAFRERRAALVSELEDRLAEIERERNAKEAKMQSTIRALSRENEQLRAALVKYDADKKPTMDDLDRALEQKLPVPTETKTSGSCGICIKDACLCEQVGLKNGSVQNDDVQEIDFTEAFARPKKRIRTVELSVPSAPSAPSESLTSQFSSEGDCGFCSEDTPCVCREAAAQEKEAAAAAAASATAPVSPMTTLPPLKDLSLPPISQERRYGSVSLETSDSRSRRKGGCTGNPGTCYQCQSDPMSTLFCTSIASKDRTRDSNGQRQPRKASLSAAEPGTFIPCAAAYQTLARHKDFRSADFSAVMSKLQTRGMEVEVNSVARVLLELDKRLYD